MACINDLRAGELSLNARTDTRSRTVNIPMLITSGQSSAHSISTKLGSSLVTTLFVEEW